MRNIARVVLWGLPPSFCALVQRAGRAARDFTKLGESILIVPGSVVKNGTTEADLTASLNDVTSGNGEGAEAANRGQDVDEILAGAGIDLAPGEALNDEGVRIQADAEEEPDVDGDLAQHQKKFKGMKDTNTHEARFLSSFVCTKSCRRKVWNIFFKNQEKCQRLFLTAKHQAYLCVAVQLIYPTTTSYQHITGARCCDNCQPDQFPVEKIILSTETGLKRGKKKRILKKQEDTLRERLVEWRETVLIEFVYPGLSSMSGQTILGDDIVDKLAVCGERLETYEELR